MGRWIVVILATLLTMSIALLVFPALREVAFHVGGYPVRWAILMGLGVTYTYYKFTD